MNYIDELRIKGFKKFDNLIVKFNKCINIIVGENEAGKSTILEAIQIVLNKNYQTADKSILKDLFNVENVNKFKRNPNVDTLPRIEIEVDLSLSPTPKNIVFSGENNNCNDNRF